MDRDLFRQEFSKKSVFKDRASLDLSFVPQKLFCRDEVIKDIIHNFRGIVESKGVFSSNCLILGKGGVGKTISAKFFGKNIRVMALEKGIDLFVEYYDCVNFRTKSKIVRTLLGKYCQGSGRGFSDDEAMKQIISKVKRDNAYILLIIDEAHLLPTKDIWALLDTAETFGHHNVRMSFLLISRLNDWIRIESERLISRINKKLKFKPYILEESKQILTYRAELAFREEVLSEDSIELISEIVVDTKNMRHGIEIMRSCGQYADKEGFSEISAEMIRKAASEIAYPAFRADIVDKLNEQELISLYAIVRILLGEENAFTTIDDSYEQYCVVCENYELEPHVKMSFRKYIRQLNTLKVLKADSSRIDDEGRGRHLKITLLDIPAKKLEEYLVEVIEKTINQE